MSRPLVVDCGSGFTKAGFGGDIDPLFVFESCVGSVNQPKYKMNTDTKYICGQNALNHKRLVSINYPIELGIIINFDDMEELWKHTFYNELRCEPENRDVMLTEKILNSKENKEKTIEIMFETFNVSSLFVGTQSILALYGSGRTTGVVLQSGYGVTNSVCINDGYPIIESILRLDLGGRDVTNKLNELIKQKNIGVELNNNIVRDIKEKLCVIGNDYDNDIKKMELNQTFVKYELPDGNIIKLGNEIIESTEILFKPKMSNINQFGISELINESIIKCDIYLKRLLYNNIIFEGGNTLFNGISTRLHNDIKQLIPNNVDVKIESNKDDYPKYSVWKGASILSDIYSFQQNWMTKNDYQQKGASYIHEFYFL